MTINGGVAQDGCCYLGGPLTQGFTTIRMPSRSLSIGLVMSDDMIVWGDMMNVQYSGAGGRGPLFQLDKIEALTRSIVIPRLSGCDASNFVGACDRVLAFHENKPLAIE